MERGEPLWVKDDGLWKEATYEFRVEQGEPLGHHSVMLKDGGGRRVVCSCCTRLPAGGTPRGTDRCLFFGCWNEPGHYLVGPGRARVHDAARVEVFGATRFHLDGSLAPRKGRDGKVTCVAWAKDEREQQDIGYLPEYPQGQFLLHVLDNGFTAIQWWDRQQGDKRSACSSTILLEGVHTSEEMLTAARLHFPHVLENLKRGGIEIVEVARA